MVRRKAAFTLVEVLICAALLGTIMAAAYFMFSSGQSAAVRGIASCEVLSAANQLEQRLTHDLAQMIVTTDTPDIVVGLGGTYAAFVVPRMSAFESVLPSQRSTQSTTSSWKVVGEEVRWHLVRDSAGLYHPTRNDHVMANVIVRNWRFSFLAASGKPLEPTTGNAVVTPGTLPTSIAKELTPLPKLDPLGGPALPASTATVPYLLLEYTLTDRERRIHTPRALVLDLENSRMKETYGQLYGMPPDFLKVGHRRSIQGDGLATFDIAWERREPEK